MSTAKEDRATTATVEDLEATIQRLRQQVAHVRVDGQRRERAALARADDCAEHGRDLVYEHHQAFAYSQHAKCGDAVNAHLLCALWDIEKLARRHGPADLAAEVSARIEAATRASDRLRRHYAVPGPGDCERAERCEHPATVPHGGCTPHGSVQEALFALREAP